MSFCPIYLTVSTSAGDKFLKYYSSNGTSYVDGNGHVCFYLGSGAAGSDWLRFERNIEEDWESVASSNWQNTDGMLIRPTSAASYDFYVDDIHFSNSRTETHNTLSGANFGQIISSRKYMSDTYGQPEDFWYSYDHIGNVMNLSDASGDEAVEYAQDAFGNVLTSAQTGVWASSPSGRHETTKELDGDVGLYYFSSRWYDPQIGRFVQRDRLMNGIQKKEDLIVFNLISRQYVNQYMYCLNNPVNYIDVSGGLVFFGCGGGEPNPTPTPTPTTRYPREPIFIDPVDPVFLPTTFPLPTGTEFITNPNNLPCHWNMRERRRYEQEILDFLNYE